MSRLNEKKLVVDGDISGNWCNDNPVSTSQMESISLVTPVLEAFFMRSVADALSDSEKSPELEQRCQDFIREEANHSRVHRAFNLKLTEYLGNPPPGLNLIGWLLDQARKRMSRPSQLLLAATLEHFAAVMSKVYMQRESNLSMASEYAREMFAMHAEEELGHRSVVFDLWRSHGSTGRFGRTLMIVTVIAAGGLYSALSVPWILYRKCGCKMGVALSSLFRFIRENWRNIWGFTPIKLIFSFAGREYHPDDLLKD